MYLYYSQLINLINIFTHKYEAFMYSLIVDEICFLLINTII